MGIEQETLNLLVVGSSPTRITKHFLRYWWQKARVITIPTYREFAPLAAGLASNTSTRQTETEKPGISRSSAERVTARGGCDSEISASAVAEIFDLFALLRTGVFVSGPRIYRRIDSANHRAVS
jgi:hypothetical protein